MVAYGNVDQILADDPKGGEFPLTPSHFMDELRDGSLKQAWTWGCCSLGIANGAESFFPRWHSTRGCRARRCVYFWMPWLTMAWFAPRSSSDACHMRQAYDLTSSPQVQTSPEEHNMDPVAQTVVRMMAAAPHKYLPHFSFEGAFCVACDWRRVDLEASSKAVF